MYVYICSESVCVHTHIHDMYIYMYIYVRNTYRTLRTECRRFPIQSQITDKPLTEALSKPYLNPI